jgi:6-phosphofructokinase 1
VDACLIPEVPFKVEKLCAHIQKCFDKCGHAVVCVAEGAGQVGAAGGR